MGQKVNPIGIRLGITRDWTSKWYAGSKAFAPNIHTDFLVREYLFKKLADASVSRIMIERAARRANITIHTARPRIVIGKKGAKIVLKVLDSAIANAYNNHNADVDDLKVTRVEVDPAPVLKRFHARAKGRGVRIAKRSSHILVQVSDGKREG